MIYVCFYVMGRADLFRIRHLCHMINLLICHLFLSWMLRFQSAKIHTPSVLRNIYLSHLETCRTTLTMLHLTDGILSLSHLSKVGIYYCQSLNCVSLDNFFLFLHQQLTFTIHVYFYFKHLLSAV